MGGVGWLCLCADFLDSINHHLKVPALMGYPFCGPLVSENRVFFICDYPCFQAADSSVLSLRYIVVGKCSCTL